MSSEKQKNRAAVVLGRLGGRATAERGHNWLRNLSPEQRREYARRAAMARWKGKKQ